MHLNHRLNPSGLIALLAQWEREDCERGPKSRDVAEQLSQWLSAMDAIKLGRALHAIEFLRPDVGAVGSQGAGLDVQALDRQVQKTRADLTRLITAKVAAPKPLRARADNTPVEVPDPQADAYFTAHGPRYLELQKQMDARLLALRAQIRHALAKGPVALRQLAALDGVMEQMLGVREQRLWASLPGCLERRLTHRQHTHQQTLQTSGRHDEPQRWRQPGGWLWAFEQDLQALLIAEMQVRLQPITGLLEAAHNEKAGQKE